MLKNLARIVLVGAITASACAQSPAPAKTGTTESSSAAVLANGTPVQLHVSPNVNVAALKVGDTVELEVAENVVLDGVAVITTNSVATAVVTSQRSQLDKSGMGKVDVNLRMVAMVDGEHVPVRPVRSNSGETSMAVVSSGAGQDISIGNGDKITAYVLGNLPVDLTRMRLVANATGEIRIATSPSNAEVSLDGKILGTTPYTAHVPRGEHLLSLRVAGYQPWRGTVHVTEAPIDMKAELKRQDSTETAPEPAAAAPSLADMARQARAKKSTQDGQKPSSDPAGQNVKPAPVTLEN